MSTWTIGIDPGKTGAIAVLDSYGCLYAVHDMPYESGQVVAPLLADIIGGYFDVDGTGYGIVAWVEKVGAMPKQGISSTWKFAQGYGTILGVLGALEVRTQHVTPAVWKRTMKVTAEKGTSRRLACELWPSKADRFARVKDDGRAEACLIAEYGRLQAIRGEA